MAVQHTGCQNDLHIRPFRPDRLDKLHAPDSWHHLIGDQEVDGSRPTQYAEGVLSRGGFDDLVPEIIEHGYCIAENEAVIVHDHDPQGTRRLPHVLRGAIRNNVGSLDLSYRQPKLSRCAPPLLACQNEPPTTLLGKPVSHGKPEPRPLAD